MSAVERHKRDPAPSRLRYRMHRMWLTPNFRWAVRYVLPTILILAAAAAFWSVEDNRFAVQGYVADLRRSVEERPEFQVHVMAIDGASTAVDQDIREIVPVDFPVSSFDLDLPGMKARIAELDAVERVDVRVRTGGVLQVDIVERVPAAVWRHAEGIELLDADGHRVAVVGSRLDWPNLPLLAGTGAQHHVDEALQLLQTAAPIGDRVRGLVRMGERRWDIVLDRDQRLMLPEEGANLALNQILALHQAQDLLDRAVIIIDYRNIKRPTIRRANLNDQSVLISGESQ